VLRWRSPESHNIVTSDPFSPAAAFKYAAGLCANATNTAPYRNRPYPSFAKALLAGRGIYFAAGLVWLPYFGKSRSVTRGAFDFCAKFLWF
jgi:hypothetical protein